MQNEIQFSFIIHHSSFIISFFHYHFIDRRSPQPDLGILRQGLFFYAADAVDRFGAGRIVLHGFGNVSNLSAEPSEETFSGQWLANAFSSVGVGHITTS
jgi:hypothetical protein